MYEQFTYVWNVHTYVSVCFLHTYEWFLKFPRPSAFFTHNGTGVL